MEPATHGRTGERSRNAPSHTDPFGFPDVGAGQMKAWVDAQLGFFQMIHDAQSSWAQHLDKHTALGWSPMASLVASEQKFARTIEEAKAEWLKRLQVEMKIASDLWSNLSKSRSPTDATSAWKEWISRRLELMTADASYCATAIQNLSAEGKHGSNGETARKPH